MILGSMAGRTPTHLTRARKDIMQPRRGRCELPNNRSCELQAHLTCGQIPPHVSEQTMDETEMVSITPALFLSPFFL
jgi:hypothetical protein